MTVLLSVTACSTKENTAKTRWWHSFNTRYNTYYNGALAYIDGSLEKENGNRDNFTEMIPLYTVGNKNSVELGKGNFDRAVEKSQKAIKLHSIKRRPQWTKSRRKTEKDIEWLSRREYNPFLWKAWMLMGRSQFHSGQFDEAASTFSYMSRLYRTQPAIYGKARAWLAKTYIEQGYMYDAEDVIRNIRRDSLDWRAVKEWDYTYADYYIHTGDFETAIPYLRKVIKHEMRRKQRAREWYLMGQLEAALGHREKAYEAFRHVVRQNPSYELAFNARIAMTEVMAQGKSKQMISRLRRMAANDNNKEYLDQVYYAIGNIYLAEKDTANAIAAYEKGNEKATRSGIEKGVLLLHLGDLYWAKEKFSDARRCYGTAIGLLDQDRPDYEQLSERSKVLDELVPYTEAVHLQDSLQELATMSEKDRNAAIDRVIEALKKKEKEEKRQQAEAEAAAMGGQGAGMNTAATNTATTAQNQSGTWYFYNPTAVSKGKEMFQRQWGRRENADNWQRSNKTVVAGPETEEQWTDEQRDSVMRAQEAEDSLRQRADSAVNDPHKREYYLAQIPFTPEQVESSNKIIEDGLYHSGVIFKDKLDHLRLGEKQLRRITDNYPDYEQMDAVYYHLFLLYSRKGMPETAEQYVGKLKREYPSSQWTAILTDPYFVENARFGTHLEDSLYTATYEAFKAGRYHEVKANRRLSDQRFPLGANRDKFVFIGGLSRLNDGDADGCLQDMKTVVEKYPESRLSEMAGMIVNGVNAGKRLRGGKFDLGDVWNQRSYVLNDSDSIAAQTFSTERDGKYLFMLVYKPDSVNENQLLFELAKFNFTNFLVRDFEINIEADGGLHRMQVAGFRSYDEALQYAHMFSRQTQIVRQMGDSRIIIISETNLALLGTRYTYDEYDQFYSKHFAPLKISTYRLLTEPAEIATEREEEPEPTIEEIDRQLDDENFYDNGLEAAPLQETETVIPAEEEIAQPVQETETVIPTEEEPAQPVQETEIVIPTEEEPAQPVQETETVIPAEEEPAQPVQETETVIPAEEEPAQPVQETETVIPAEEEIAQPVQETETVIPVEEEIEQPVQETETVIPAEEEPARPSVSMPKTTTVTTGQPAPQTTGKPAIAPISTPATSVQPVIEDEGETVIPDEDDKEEDTGIYFDDDEPAEVTTPQQQAQPQQQGGYDLEDEYYDLDGF